jgi:REP element-mobilizing transposase RayT
MPRKARIKAKSGIYHVLLQGVRRRELFLDDEDSRQFLDILARCQKEDAKGDASGSGKRYTVFAYCMAGEYVHLLIKEEEDPINISISRIAVAYAHYLNNKYDRDGAVYRDRYYSEPVDEEGRFNIILRYIHQTPLRDKLAETLEEYPYSSWHEYVGEDSDMPCVCDIREEYRKMSTDDVKRMLQSEVPGSIHCLGPKAHTKHRPADSKVREEIKRITGATDVAEYLRLPMSVGYSAIKELRKSGASIRQLERLTGLGRGVIQSL